MQVTLNKKSWHFWLYSKVVSDKPPSSLCPYFWSVFGITLLLPVILFAAGFIWIAEYFSEKKYNKIREMSIEEWVILQNKKEQRAKKINRNSELAGKVILIVILTLAAITLIVALVEGVKKLGFWSMVQGILTGIGAIVVVFVTIWLLLEYWPSKWLRKMISYINPFKWKISLVIWEMIKTIYTKACPLIKWNENAEKIAQEKSAHL
jgi:hypothetical protein